MEALRSGRTDAASDQTGLSRERKMEGERTNKDKREEDDISVAFISSNMMEIPPALSQVYMCAFSS